MKIRNRKNKLYSGVADRPKGGIVYYHRKGDYVTTHHFPLSVCGREGKARKSFKLDGKRYFLFWGGLYV